MAEDHWDRHGFGLWMFYDRTNDSFVGRAGILHYTLDDLYGRKEVGLAYAVNSPWWGKGMATHNCSKCAIRARYDRNPQSLIGRLWRWHIRFCPGWKSYIKSLDDTERSEIEEKYPLTPS